MINWTYSFVLFLCFLICILTEDPLVHPHRPDTEPDMDLKPAIRIPEPESTSVKSTRSYMNHDHDFSLPVPNTMNWPVHPNHEDASDHSHHDHEDYEYYNTFTVTGSESYVYESGDYETVIPENSKNDDVKDGGVPKLKTSPERKTGKESTNDQLASDAADKKVLASLSFYAIVLFVLIV